MLVLGGMLLAVVLGNSRSSGVCPVHHLQMHGERCVDIQSHLSAEATKLLKSNPNAGIATSENTSIFSRHAVRLDVCPKCRGNYLAATSLSKVYTSPFLELPAPELPPED